MNKRLIPLVMPLLTVQLRRSLKEKGMENIACSIRFADELRPDPHTGKKRLVLRDAHSEREELACE